MTVLDMVAVTVAVVVPGVTEALLEEKGEVRARVGVRGSTINWEELDDGLS